MQNSFQIENPNPSFLETSHRDSWWIGPFFTDIGLLAFVVDSTWAAFQNELYQWESYLPPLLCTTAWTWLVAPLTSISDPLGSSRISAHLLLLPQGLLQVAFSNTVGLRGGEEALRITVANGSLLFQNLHRYFLYLALVFCIILSYDVIFSFSFEDGFGVRVGTVV